MTEQERQKREEAYQAYMLKFMQGYFDTRRDEEGMKDWVKLMNLGCFGQEFHIYALAYEDEQGVAYRCSAKANNLFAFAHSSALYGYYPTPVIANIQRRSCPSGCEETIKGWLKKETARLLREKYNSTYFKAMHSLGTISANNAAKPLMAKIQEYLEGRYIAEELDLFESLLLEAVQQKKLTSDTYRYFSAWLKDMRKQLANDIQVKGRYEKNLSGFAYIDENNNLKYFSDAFLQTTYEAREQYELEGKTVTPVYEKKYWLQEAGELPKVKKEFTLHLQQCFDERYLQVFLCLRSLPGVIDQQLFDEQAQIVKENCSLEAWRNFLRYGRRWGVK